MTSSNEVPSFLCFLTGDTLIVEANDRGCVSGVLINIVDEGGEKRGVVADLQLLA
jgi:hypothetical protein